MKEVTSAYLKSVALIVGTIIGAGVLGIPYVIAKAGLWTGLLSIFLLGSAIVIVHLYIGEITLRTKEKHQLSGYAEKYIGVWGKRIMALAMIFAIYGSLIAYLIGEGQAINSITGISSFWASILFFVLMCIFVYAGLKAIDDSELVLGSIMVFIILIICGFALVNMKGSNLSGFSLSKLFIPYGVIFFAMIGTSAIPEVRFVMDKHKKSLKKAIIVGTLVPIFIYALFAFVSVGVIGGEILKLNAEQQIASVALGIFMGTYMNILANFFAIFSMATSFLALGLALKWMFNYDYGIRKIYSVFLVCSIPLIVFLLNYVLNITTFVSTLGIVGAVGGGIEGVLIVLMHSKAKKKGDREPEFKIKGSSLISFLLVLIFIAGIISVFV